MVFEFFAVSFLYEVQYGTIVLNKHGRFLLTALVN